MTTKVVGASVNVTTGNNVNSARVVRAFASAATLVTVTTSADVTIGSFIMPANAVEFIEKNPTDKLVANVALQCTPAAYTG